MEHGRKLLWLGLILEVIDAYSRDIQQDQGHTQKEHEFFLGDVQRHVKASDCGTVASEFEEAKQPQHPEGPNRTQVNSCPEVERQDGCEIDDAEKTEDVCESGRRDQDSQGVLNAEDNDAEYLNAPKPRLRRRGEVGKCFNGKGNQREDDERLNAQIEGPSQPCVAPLEHLLES